MGENTYISRGAVFTNVFFNIKLSAREIAGKYLIHGHRCMPFVRPDISCGRIDFKYKGKLLAHKIVTLPVNEAVDYFFLYGEEYALQIILSDPANENNGMSQEDTSIQNVNLMATDLSPLFEDVTIKKSDYLQGTISNWSLSFVDLYPLVNKKENALNDLMILNSNKFLYSHNIALNFRHDRKSGHNSVSFFWGGKKLSGGNSLHNL